MPAQITGLESFGGNGQTGNPNITVSNAVGNTPFLGGVANAGVGTGSLGEFGGYIPTPLPQFNNYNDYLNTMPGALQMQSYADMPLFFNDMGNLVTGANATAGNSDFGSSALYGYVRDILNDPNQAQALGATNQAAQMAMGYGTGQGGFIQNQWLPFANKMFGMSDQVWNSAQNQSSQLFGLEDPLIQQGFDPQNALYARTAQQLQDQTRAGLAARGLSMDPYGAGVEGSTMSNFNIDWQNNQLQRETQAAQAVQGLAGAGSQILQGGAGVAGTLGQGAAALQDQSAQDIANYGRMPMDLNQEIIRNQMDAQTQFAQYAQQAANPYQQASANWQNIQNQFLTANQQSFNQNQTSGFEDPFALLQLQSQIEMQREQMNLQEQMQKDAQKSQMAMQGAQAGLGLLGGMGGK